MNYLFLKMNTFMINKFPGLSVQIHFSGSLNTICIQIPIHYNWEKIILIGRANISYHLIGTTYFSNQESISLLQLG